MINHIKNICVFSSSSNLLEEVYYQAATELGILIGKSGFNLVYGGSTLGTMGANAKAVKQNGGRVIAVIPEKLHSVVDENKDCDELHVTKCMRSRKDKIDQISDAVIALAGGFGTLEELSEMIVQKQLGYNQKAIVILNTNGFYNNLLKFFEDIIGQNFAITEMREFYYIAKTPQDAINYLLNYTPKEFDFSKKFIKNPQASTYENLQLTTNKSLRDFKYRL